MVKADNLALFLILGERGEVFSLSLLNIMWTVRLCRCCLQSWGNSPITIFLRVFIINGINFWTWVCHNFQREMMKKLLWINPQLFVFKYEVCEQRKLLTTSSLNKLHFFLLYKHIPYINSFKSFPPNLGSNPKTWSFGQHATVLIFFVELIHQN